MSSVNDVRACPECQGNLATYLDVRTQEYHDSCSRCGFERYAKLKREHSRMVREDKELPLDGSVVLGILSSGKLIWENPLLGEIPEDELWQFFNASTAQLCSEVCRADVPDWIRSILHIKGDNNIFLKGENGEAQKLIYICDAFRFEKDEAGILHFYLVKALWDIGYIPGNGEIRVLGPDKSIICFPVMDKSKDEMLMVWDGLLGKREARPDEYLTWFDVESEQLQCLRGTMPPDYEDYDDEMLPDSDYSHPETSTVQYEPSLYAPSFCPYAVVF